MSDGGLSAAWRWIFGNDVADSVLGYYCEVVILVILVILVTPVTLVTLVTPFLRTRG
jgi:hypothetical protein